MNHKLHSFPKKSITFKTATFIVIGVHVLAIAGIVSWSNYNSNIAKQKRIDDNLKRLARPSSMDWPKSELKPQIVAKPSPTPRKEPTKPVTGVVADNTNLIKEKVVEAVKKTSEVVAQTDINEVTKKLKQEFLKTKKLNDVNKFNTNNNIIKSTTMPTGNIVKSTPMPANNVVKSTRIVSEGSGSPVIETFERRVISSRSTSDIVISPETVKTYVSNGIHYIQLN